MAIKASSRCGASFVPYPLSHRKSFPQYLPSWRNLLTVAEVSGVMKQTKTLLLSMSQCCNLVVLWGLGECENYKHLGIWWYQISDPLLSCLTSIDILFSTEYRNSKFTSLFPYFAKFTFRCFSIPLCQIVRWHCRILTLLVCVHNLLTPQFYFSILPNCQVHSTLWAARKRFKLPTNS
jgi:hypothetical protein